MIRFLQATLFSLGLFLFPLELATARDNLVGERVIAAHHAPAALRNADGSDRLRITVWYPARTDSTPSASSNGLLAVERTTVRDASPERDDRRPVILLSHGYGGAAQAMSWFATAMAEAGYIVIAVDHPGNNGIDPMTKAGAAMFFERPDDLIAAFDHVSKDEVLGDLLDTRHVGAAGFSAGGFTTLALAGGRIDPTALRRFCKTQPEDGVCRPQLEFGVPIAEVLEILESADARMRIDEIEGIVERPRVSALLVMAPAIVQAFNPESLKQLTMDATFVLGSADNVAPNPTNGLIAAGLLPSARMQMVAGAGHYDFLSECTAKGREVLPFCAHQRETAAAHKAAIREALDLFGRTIGSEIQSHHRQHGKDGCERQTTTQDPNL